MNALTLLAFAAVFTAVQARSFLIIRSNDITLPASEKISKRSLNGADEEVFYLEEADVGSDEQEMKMEKRAISGLYDNVDDMRFWSFRKGLIKERF
ncbi:hypothetical protein BDFB_007303 [Asbolus verrucosus]|uniref:RxLR effector protein n=1 Tax=Asbolus verrucosus TaxID=1661398 RepID=A0A482V942_ASBVE|nr:hypothetical protein BDFB_007303 [Asbolus verrucosus]